MSPDAIAKSGSESAHQKALFAWAAMAKHFGFSVAFLAESYAKGAAIHPNDARPVPALDWLFAIPNGGKRDAITASRLKAEGVRAGVHDVFWPFPTQQYAGLFIEMKVDNNKLTDEQKVFGAVMIERCYAVAVCYSWREAAMVIQLYYSGERIGLPDLS